MNLLTRRFPTILGLLLLIAAAVGGWWYLQTQNPRVSADIVPAKVRITNVADNKFTVSWTTPAEVEGYIEYGAVGDQLTNVAYDDRDNKVSSSHVTHHITVTELQPETQYAFRIISGSGHKRFDNNGSPYSVMTGPTIASTPAAKSIYGDVSGADTSAAGAIVYLALPGAAPASTLVTSSNKYSFPLSLLRTSDLKSYIEYDAEATIANITVEDGSLETIVSVTTANAEPVPKILLGQNADYVHSQVPPVAQVEPLVSPEPSVNLSPSPTASAAIPGVFNIQPLAGTGGNPATEVVLLNPSKEGETLATTRPEFQGLGPKSTVISITVRSITPYSDTVVIGQDGKWKWSPPADLDTGNHTITISYIDANGNEKTLTRSFKISATLAAQGDPAFVSTPSASLRASSSPAASLTGGQGGVQTSPSPSPTPSPSLRLSPSPTTTVFEISPSPRDTMPSTESGVPVTGVFSTTLLTGFIGLVIMVIGAFMLAL